MTKVKHNGLRPRDRYFFGLIFVFSAASSFGSLLHAEVGVTDKEILIGQSSPLTGPSSARGIQSRIGAEVYLKKINAAGGINGRQVKLLVRDDGYEPQRTFSETKKLLNDDKVFALFQYYGTPGVKAVFPTITEHKIPFIAAFTGAEVLRNPVLPNIFNVRAGYMDEMRALFEYAVKQRNAKEVVLVYQDDAFGTEGKAAAYKAMTKQNLKIVAEFPFKRNETDMSPLIEKIRQTKVKNVIAWMLAGQGTDFVKNAAAKNLDADLYAMSGILDSKFCEAANSYHGSVFVSSVLPSLTDKSNLLVHQYLADSKVAGATPEPGAFEGYVNAIVLTEGLKRGGRELTRESFTTALEKMGPVDIYGLKIEYKPDDHRGIQSVFVAHLKNCELKRGD